MMPHQTPPLLAIDVAALAATLTVTPGDISVMVAVLAGIYYAVMTLDLIRKWFKG